MKKIFFIAFALFSLGVYAQNVNPNQLSQMSELKTKEIMIMIGDRDDVKSQKVKELIYNANREVANNPGLSEARREVLFTNLEGGIRKVLSSKEADLLFSNKEFVSSLIMK